MFPLFSRPEFIVTGAGTTSYHYESYPESLGLEVAAQVPTGDPKAYRKWIKFMRALLDKMDESPSPLFALSAMPDSPKLFLESIGFDSFGHRSYSKTTPEKHIYNWTSAPPAVEDSAIAAYAAREQDSEMSVTDLLGITGSMGCCQTVRIELLQFFISTMMLDKKFAPDIRRLEASPDRNAIPFALPGLGVAMVNAAIGPILSRKDIPRVPEDVQGFVWLSSNICLHITTHLDDERNRQKDILRLVNEIVRARKHPEIKYGILFSFFHCVIVSVDANTDGFKCTPPLQFLPSRHATSPSTLGITAVAVLAHHALATKTHGVSKARALPPNHSSGSAPHLSSVLRHSGNSLSHDSSSSSQRARASIARTIRPRVRLAQLPSRRFSAALLRARLPSPRIL
ncbi:hypothetical protein C8J57DRAFT_1652305 [Mycena rebaudengoi]|nr:hypothetical protein C8J57DRAFT_1652305 [Mycena rebaudengoi]